MKIFSKDNYIFLILITFLLGIFITLLMQKFQFFNVLSDLVRQNMGIIAVVASPLIALWVGDMMRKRTDKHKEEIEVFKNLISYRHHKGSSEFLSALNRVSLIFDKNEKIKQQVKELWRSYTNKENQLVSKQKEVELVYEICKFKGYDISEFEIDNFFVSDGPPLGVPTIQIIQQNPSNPQAPSSTGNIADNDFKTSSSSISQQTITSNIGFVGIKEVSSLKSKKFKLIKSHMTYFLREIIAGIVVGLILYYFFQVK